MKFASKLLVAILTFIALTGAVFAQSDDPNRTSSPTVIGATGLFTVFDATTLKRGEFNISFFYNNFKRDPGSVHIENIPVNGTLGFGRLELFFNIDLNQQITVRRPDALSGFLLPQVVSPGGFSGFSQTNGVFAFNGLPFLKGALRGGILPGVPVSISAVPILVQSQFGLDLRIPGTNTPRPGFGPFCNKAVDPNCVVRVFPIPPFLFDQDIMGFQGIQSSYLNNYPFIGRTNGNGLGNVTTGGKFRLNSEKSRLQFAVLGMVRIPTITDDNLFSSSGLLRGRGAGAIDVGGFVIMTTHIRSATFSANLGYIHDGSPHVNGTEVLNRADELHSGVGISIPFKRHFQFVTELTDEAYVGGRTANLFQKSPFEYRAGLRFFPKSWIQIGATYQLLLNQFNEIDQLTQPFVNVNVTDQIVTANRNIRSTDPHGFMAYISFNRRHSVPPPIVTPAINHAPVVSCSASASVVTKGVDSSVVTITANASDQDNDLMTYTWSASGGAALSGSGSSVTVDTSTLPAGSYSVTVTVNDGHDHPTPCTANFSVTIPEKRNNCPVVNQVTADPSSVEQGTNTRITLHAVARDADGDSLTYQWSADRGSISGNGDTVTLDTSGLGAGTVNISVSASDGKCQGNGSASVNISSKPPVPEATKLADCTTYKARNVTRADNVCKGFLDGVGAKMQQDPRATLVIQGYADANEKPGAAQARAESVRDFLVTVQHVDANRIKIVALGSKPSPNATGGNNRITTVWIVPEGAAEPQF